MTWWDGFLGFIDDIKRELWGWVDNIAKYWVQRAHEWYDILRHSWDDVLDAVESAKSYAELLLSDVWSEFNKVWERIGAIPVITYDVVKGWVTPLIESAKVYLENLLNNAIDVIDGIINTIWSDINNIWDNIDNILNVTIPDIKNSIQSAWDWINNVDNWIDNKINEFRERIEGWIEESFITIIEHVLEMEIGGRR